MEPIEDWLDETLEIAGLDKRKTVKVQMGAAEVSFRDHSDELFEVDHCPNVMATGELYAAPEPPKRLLSPEEGNYNPEKIIGKERRELEALTAQVVNTIASVEALSSGKPDMVTLPHHYARFAIEPIRFAVENNLNFLQANIIKYVLRFDAKNGMEDLDKAMRYLTMLKRWVAKDPDWWKP